MVGLIVAAALAAFLGALLIRLGPSLGYLDRPDEGALKAHTRPAVPLGGVAIFTAVHIAMAIEGAFDPGLFAGSALLLVVGLVDDRVGLSPGMRLVTQVVAATVFSVGISGNLRESILAGVLVVVAVNAVNLFDGLDGLAAASALVGAVGMVFLSVARSTSVGPTIVLVGALLGFLVFNWHPARLFLGDSGAYVTAMFLVSGLFSTAAGPGEVLVGAGLLGVFLVDLAATVLRRRMVGHPLFAGDRSHTYDRLRDRGLGVPAVALAAGALQAVFVAAVLLLDRFASPVGGVAGVIGLGALAVIGASRSRLLAVRDPV